MVARILIGEFKVGQERIETEILEEATSLLSTKDVARLLNVHINTVRRWAIEGGLKSFRVSPRGDRRFYADDVGTLLARWSMGERWCSAANLKRARPMLAADLLLRRL